MNTYDLQAIHALKCYYVLHRSYPPFIEATPEALAEMTCAEIVILQRDEAIDGALTINSQTSGPFFTELTSGPPASDFIRVKQTTIPVLPVSDWKYRKVIVRQCGLTPDTIEDTAKELFHRQAAKLTRAGLVISEPIITQGLESYIPPWFFYQMITFVYGPVEALEATIQV